MKAEAPGAICNKAIHEGYFLECTSHCFDNFQEILEMKMNTEVTTSCASPRQSKRSEDSLGRQSLDK